jgi:hypothetical protein
MKATVRFFFTSVNFTDYILPERIELEIARVIDTPQATHIRYRIRR